MKKHFVLGAICGFAVGAAAAVAGAVGVGRVAGEIKGEMEELCFTSPDGDHTVTVTHGASKSAKGLTFFRVKAMSDTSDDSCKLSLFTKKTPETFDAQWSDNDHCTLTVASGKWKQCVDVSYEGEEIRAVYALHKL